MNRRDTVLALLGLGVAPLRSVAQQRKVWRVGYLSSESRLNSGRYDAFLQGMRDLGYVEGKQRKYHRPGYRMRRREILAALCAGALVLPVPSGAQVRGRVARLNLREGYKRLAAFVDKVLRGIDAGSIPVEQPTTFELVLNLKVAKALGIAFPSSLLLRAHRVIE